MAADREDVDGLIVEAVDQAIPGGETSGPEARQRMPKGLRLTRSRSWIVPEHFLEDPAQGSMQLWVALPERFVGGPGITLEYQ